MIEKIYSFDSTVSVDGQIVRPDRYRDLYRYLSEGTFVPRGAGSSYVLASAGENVRSVLSERFNRILGFDSDKGIIEAEAGVPLGDLVQFLSSRGWWLSVLPGHPSITLGGAIAFNTHGKSQFRHGCIGDKVLALSIFHPERGLFEASQSSNKDMLELTVGAMGLTGFIVSAKIQCEKLQGNAIRRERVPVRDLQEAASVFAEKKDGCDQIFSWNNFNVTGKAFGRGFVYVENYISKETSKFRGFHKLVPPPRHGGWAEWISPLVRNRLGQIYEFSEKLKPRTEEYELLQGAFPFNGKEIYHRLFGRSGLLESQFIIPPDRWLSVAEDLRKIFEHHRVRTTLGSLKLFKGIQKFLYFQGEGICLSFDIPYSLEGLKLFSAIDNLIVENNCLPSLSKDSRLPAAVVQGTYREYDAFRTKLHDFDPKNLVRSELRRRLSL